jgi:predicted RecA/RadA family phage recombinase
MANYAQYVQDDGAIDYTPGSAVTAGQVVVQGDLIGVARTPIAANALGSLAIEGIFDFPKDAGNSVATATSTGNKQLGKVVAAAADADTTVRVNLDSMAAAANNPVAANIADPGSGVAIPVTASGHCDIVSGAAGETNTLAVPTFAGQQLLLTLKTDGGGDRVVTVADPHIDGTNNTITLNDAGDTVLLVGVAIGASFGWRMVVNVGATLSHV